MAGSNRLGIVVQPRDRKLLEELTVLKLIDREQAKLFGGFTSTTRANARLLALTRAGLLKRTFVGTIAGGRKAIYTLPGKRNTRLWKSGGVLARESAVAHQLALNRVYFAFKYLPPPQPGVQLLEWHAPETVLSPSVPLIPDAILRISTPGGEMAAFLEVDLGTEDLRVWERKVDLYMRLAVTGEHRNHFDANRFRVLVVASASRRLESIRATIVQQTSQLFWLATSEVLEGEGVWSPIWQRPRAQQLHALWIPGQ